jgi:hypothetical protein
MKIKALKSAKCYIVSTDLILIQGPEVVFKVALVLLGNHKELIIQCSSFETVVEFIKTTLPEMGMIQMERVINQVNKKMFSMISRKSIETRGYLICTRGRNQ